MAQQNIDRGTKNDPNTGDSLWDAAKKINDNFTELYAGGSGGDMLKATYDPTSVDGDAFAMDNMVEGATTKILTDVERAAIVTNTSKVSFPEAPIDGTQYARKDGAWEAVAASGGDEFSDLRTFFRVTSVTLGRYYYGAYADAGYGSSTQFATSLPSVSQTTMFRHYLREQQRNITGVFVRQGYYSGGSTTTQAEISVLLLKEDPLLPSGTIFDDVIVACQATLTADNQWGVDDITSSITQSNVPAGYSVGVALKILTSVPHYNMIVDVCTEPV